LAFTSGGPKPSWSTCTGSPTPIRLTDPEGKKPGWQRAAGEYGDRDLAFFDAVLTAMKKTGRVDERRIYATGHSNGGIFVYLLWAVRGDVFAAVATSSSQAATEELLPRLTPKPLFHIAGEKDPIVTYALQMETISYVLSLNGCGTAIPRWIGNRLCTLHPSTNGTLVVTWLHRGGHIFQSEAVPLIVAFLQEHAKP
jgi:polyhydroxybutyrate depolymerase